MTATSSQISATTPRSCEIRTIAAFVFPLEAADQIKHLRLNGDVERGGRLVGDQQLWIAGQRNGDHRALAHAAGKLVRIVVHALFGRRDLDVPQQLDGAGACLRPAQARDGEPAFQ